jgi:hypothetical protein
MDTQTQVRPDPVYVNGLRFELSTNARNQPVARMFRQSKNGEKFVKGYFFNDEARRAAWIVEMEHNAAQNAERLAKQKEDKRKARVEFINPYKVGQILYTSWGYDQTNIDFYQITATTPKGIKYRRIGRNMEAAPGCSSMSGYTTPCPGEFRENASEHTSLIQISSYQGKTFYGVQCDGHSASLHVDGQKHYCSWYA